MTMFKSANKFSSQWGKSEENISHFNVFVLSRIFLFANISISAPLKITPTTQLVKYNIINQSAL